MHKILMTCPECSASKLVEVNSESFFNNKSGIVAINIMKNQICPHNFIAYIDRNLNIRDYIITDFEINIPEISTKQGFESKKIPENGILNVDLIKMYLLPHTLIYMIRGLFFNKTVILLAERKFIRKHLIEFFNYLFQNSFKINILILSKKDYTIHKKKYKDSLVVEGKEIKRDYDKIINSKKLHIEENIVYTFYNEPDSSVGVILIKNEIQKAYYLSVSIVEYIDKYEKGKKINLNNILKYLEEIYNIKVSKVYFNFLLDIVRSYFRMEVPTFYESFLGFL